MSLAPAERLIARDVQISKRKAEIPDTYAPFTIDEYRSMPLDYAFIDECVQWPAAASGAPAVRLLAAGARYPDVPVLVISGELDNMTSPADGAAAAARFPRARHVVIANSFHVNALPHARSDCGAILVRRFVEQLETGDEGCAAAVPAVRLVPRFARHLRELPAARALAGNAAGEDQLRAVSAALLTSADVIARAEENGAGAGTMDLAGSARGAAAAVARGCQRRNRHGARPLGKQSSGGGRAGTLGRRGGRPLAAHATGGIYQQPRSRTHHGESGPDQKRQCPGVMARQIGNDRRGDQAAGVTAGVEQP